MIFIGDLSKKDYEILQTIKNKKVLEYGVGGSTQILCQNGNEVLSVDTEQNWINLVDTFINEELQLENRPTFITYDKVDAISGTFDVVFVDGESGTRADFVSKSWKLLKPEGIMIIHDCRQPPIQDVLSKTYLTFASEIDNMQFCVNRSNMAVITKRLPITYRDWNQDEGRAAWMIGLHEPLRPADWRQLITDRYPDDDK